MPHTATSFCLALAVALLPSPAAARQTQPQRINRLIEQLGDDSCDVREAAERALKDVGDPAIPSLAKAAGHQDPEIRRRVGRLLPLLSAAKAKRLLADLESKDKAARQAAIDQLGEMLREGGEPFGRQAVIDAVAWAIDNRRDAALRKEAEAVLNRACAPRVKQLIGYLGDDEFRKRSLAERELLRIGKPALELLKQEANNLDLEVRNRSQKLVKKIEAAR